ncbi:hypothetical protein DV096_04525 [Bradymonadaceae bacterium TMQ3]|nr:hypothetical protein DV096_04525 [Bradymonadaceae bacterium TMQ3]TXC77421.1 hypothetical protein FRC91_01410 [Bradymonadales bacterium TMQ1]
MEWYLMGDECEDSSIPRYVLPALPEVYELERFKAAPYYATFGEAMTTSSPVPNSGLYEERYRIVNELFSE